MANFLELSVIQTACCSTVAQIHQGWSRVCFNTCKPKLLVQLKQRKLVSKMKRGNRRKLWVYIEIWESLCDLVKTVSPEPLL